MNAKDVAAIAEPLQALLEALPGRLPQKQAFFTQRFHLRVPKTNYARMWDALGAAGHLARAKFIFDYARAKLSDRVRASLAELRRGPIARRPSDPPILDLFTFQNGKARRLGALLAAYLPTDDGKTVLARPNPKVLPTPSQAPTEVARPKPSTAPATVRTVVSSEATTRTNDVVTGPWWRNQTRFERLDRLGKGGMGFVYLVRDRRSGREFAAKVIDPKHRKDEDYQARFGREVLAQSLLRHRHILRIVEHGRDYYICEVCPQSLHDVLGGRALPRIRALGLFAEACEGVTFAHAQRVLHRDLKPSNLLLRKGGDLVVADFGLCKIDASELTTVTKSGIHGGTFRYAAPEQWANLKRADHRADVYSLGVILQDLLTGSTKAEIGDATTLTQVRAQPFVEIVNRATAYRLEDRYQSVADLHKAVATAGRART